jgi:hypothetical protein
MKIIYEAEDGTNFYSELECAEYEKTSNRQYLIDQLVSNFNLSVVASRIIIDNIIEINQIVTKSSNYKLDLDWAKVPIGTEILVKDYSSDDWQRAEFCTYKPDENYPYICTVIDHYCNDAIGYRIAKLA